MITSATTLRAEDDLVDDLVFAEIDRALQSPVVRLMPPGLPRRRALVRETWRISDAAGAAAVQRLLSEYGI